MKLSARNVLKGKVAGIDEGQVTAIVRVDIGGGNVITSSITMAALKDLGLKKGSDGMRTFQDGSKLTLRIDRPADASDEHIAKDNQLKRDWAKIGISLSINPVPPTSFDDNWKAGRYMCHSNWEVGDGPNHLLYPQWMLPMEYSRWAPLQGQMYNSIGTKAFTSEKDVDPWKRHPPRIMPEKGGPIEKLWNIYDTTKTSRMR
jgi:peptide/nickel transport system substrate-binding protein